MPSNASQAFLRELDKKHWPAADPLHSNLDAAVYKHAVLGLIFLYLEKNVFWVPTLALRSDDTLVVRKNRQATRVPSLPKFIDHALEAIEKENPKLIGSYLSRVHDPAINFSGFKGNRERPALT